MTTLATGIYDVEVVVPCEMTWCISQRDNFEKRMSQLTADELKEMPSASVTDTANDGLALALSWVDVPAENAWSAIAHVAAIMATAFPDVYGQAVDLRITSAIQDPDPERRRPVGA